MALESCLQALAPALASGLALSWLLENRLMPRPQPFRRRPAAAAVHTGLWLLLFAGELVLFRRPWFAMANVFCLHLLLVLVSNAKRAVLREPFIHQDFEYFTDALRHPRLYLPFFGVANTLLATAAFLTALFAGITLETSLVARFSLPVYLGAVALVALAGLGLWQLGGRRLPAAAFQPDADLERLGLAGCLRQYARAENQAYQGGSPYDTFGVTADRQNLPNLVVVQSESFFDVRDYYAGIDNKVLTAYDALRATAVRHGKLRTPAWGANTVRAEFAFLSGLAAEQLGVHQFNPYRRLARTGIGNMAGFLRKLGYRTVCIHPYPATFYRRDQVFPLLGFDEFIDIHSFTAGDRSGPFVGDAVLAERVCALLPAAGPQPVFVFVITMENHGPLHLEKMQPQEADYFTQPLPDGCQDLAVYLRHLGHADLMAGRLRDHLAGLPGQHWLCWYGDHVPIMADVYARLGLPDGRTDYLIWQSGHSPRNPDCRELALASLGERLLRDMGLITPATGTCDDTQAEARQ